MVFGPAGDLGLPVQRRVEEESNPDPDLAVTPLHNMAELIVLGSLPTLKHATPTIAQVNIKMLILLFEEIRIIKLTSEEIIFLYFHF